MAEKTDTIDLPDDSVRALLDTFGDKLLDREDDDDSPDAVDELDPDEDLDSAEPKEQEVHSRFSLKDLEPPTVLFVLNDYFGGKAWWKWDAVAILEVLADRFELVEADRDMIWALQHLLVGETFWTEWDVFNYVTQALNDKVVDFRHMPPLRPEEMVTSLTTADFVLQLTESVGEYSSEVVSYIAVMCWDGGFWAVPEPLSLAQERINELALIQGAGVLPVERVKDLAESNKNLDEDTEINVQARRYRYLQEFKQNLSRESLREIKAYKATK